MEHTYHKRNNASCVEIKGCPMFICSCGKKYQTKRLAEQHARRSSNGN